MGLLAKILGWGACPSGVDLTFATHLTARSSSECQIQNSARNLRLLLSLESDHQHAAPFGVESQAASDRPLVSGSNNAARMIRPYPATAKIPMSSPRGIPAHVRHSLAG